MNPKFRVNESKGEVTKLDKIDKKILCAMFSRKRKTQKQIAKQARVSKEVVNYRLRRLSENGVLNGAVVFIDTTKLGYNVNIMYIKLQKIDRERQKQIINQLSQNKFVKVVATCTGPWDMFIVFCSHNTKHQNEIIINFQNICKNNLKRYRHATILQEEFLSLDYLHSTKFGTTATKENTKLDKKDLEILSILSVDAFTPLVEMAEQVKLTPEAISYRIKKLTKSGVILGILPLVNISLLGYHWYTVSLFLHNLTDKRLNSLIYYLKEHKNIVCVIRTFGQWNLEFDIHVKSSPEFSKILTDIREEYSDIINDFESNLIFYDYKYTHLPNGLLEK